MLNDGEAAGSVEACLACAECGVPPGSRVLLPTHAAHARRASTGFR